MHAGVGHSVHEVLPLSSWLLKTLARSLRDFFVARPRAFQVLTSSLLASEHLSWGEAESPDDANGKIPMAKTVA